MKKFAFTLSEIIVAIAIIAIITALTLPLVNKARPDKTKMLFLKTYDELAEAVHTLANNAAVYGDFGEDDSDYTLNPFLNTEEAILYDKAITAGDNKLCRALAIAYAEDEPACSDTDPTSLSFADLANDDISFTAINNVTYRIRTKKVVSETENKYVTTIVFDLNNAEKPNCTISQNCQNPDRFVFAVYANGKIEPADIMSQYYLDTRTNPRKVETSYSILSNNSNYTTLNPIVPKQITASNIVTSYDEDEDDENGSEGDDTGT